MKRVKIKENLDHKKLEELGYNYVMMEAGYISKDRATIICIERNPYKREVMQYRGNVENEHIKNVEKLKELGFLE